MTILRLENGLVFCTKRVIPSPVSLAWACRVSMSLVVSRYFKKVENGPATVRKPVRFT